MKCYKIVIRTVSTLSFFLNYFDCINFPTQVKNMKVKKIFRDVKNRNKTGKL